MRQYLLIVIFVSGLVVRTDMRTFDNPFYFLEYLASVTHDGGKVLFELFHEGRIIVVYLLNDEGINVHMSLKVMRLCATSSKAYFLK